MTADTIMPPVHPGEILLEEFLGPLGVSQYQLAKAVDVPARRINEIVHGQRRITADTALRLARQFGTSERFWMNLQARYDLEAEKDRLGGALDAILDGLVPEVRVTTNRADDVPVRPDGGTESLDEQARRKGVRTIRSADDLAQDGVFDTDEELDAFLAHVAEMRHADLA